jgi:hypothetical protein
MEQFYCDPYKAKLSAAVCAGRYRQVNASSPNPGTAERLNTEKCRGCSVGLCHVQKREAPRVEYTHIPNVGLDLGLRTVAAGELPQVAQDGMAVSGGKAWARNTHKAEAPKASRPLPVVQPPPRPRPMPEPDALDSTARADEEPRDEDEGWRNEAAPERDDERPELLEQDDDEQQEASMSKVMIKCEDCPTKIERKGPRTKLCAPCKRQRLNVNQTAWRARKRAEEGREPAPRRAVPPPALETKAPRAARETPPPAEEVSPDNLERARKVLAFVGLKVNSWVQTPQGLVLQVHEVRD